MSISNELSCDVAAAMLTPNEGETRKRALTEIVLAFHSALRKLGGAERQRRRDEILRTPLAAESSAASGGH